MMQGLLEGKVALVTGGVRGIGLAIAEKFAQNGADLVVTTTKDMESSAGVLEKLRSYGGRVEAVKLDVADKAAVEAAMPEIISRMGRLDVLVNNAGITRDGLLMRMPEADWDDVMRVDLKSAYNTIQAVLPTMMRQRGGSIINISSVVGVRGNAGQANYAAAKAGLIALARTVAKEMGGKGIRANSISPGFIMSGMTKQIPEEIVKDWCGRIALKRPGQPEEVAGVALFLASDLSSYVSGEDIPCCGCMNG